MFVLGDLSRFSGFQITFCIHLYIGCRQDAFKDFRLNGFSYCGGDFARVFLDLLCHLFLSGFFCQGTDAIRGKGVEDGAEHLVIVVSCQFRNDDPVFLKGRSGCGKTLICGVQNGLKDLCSPLIQRSAVFIQRRKALVQCAESVIQFFGTRVDLTGAG